MTGFSTSGRGRLYDSITDTVGNTPAVKLANISPAGVTVYVKAEFFNPAASVKDRLALSIIEHAERTGALTPGQTVVEATSGNTGIGLAMVCAAKGYPLVITMVETFSVERRRLMRMLGAKVILTPKAEKGTGMVRKAKELAEAHGWFFARQFETEANAAIHEATTGPEIVADFAGHRLDAVVTGYGTGGTFTGISRVLRRERPETKIYLAEPDAAPQVASGEVQPRNPDGTASASHPKAAAHPIQGWTPDFIPAVLQDGLDHTPPDAVLPVSGAEGMDWARRLAAREGILTGISGGATLAVAMKLAAKAAPGTVILAMLPDTGERYLSTPLFEAIEPEMTEEEREIMRSTPGVQM
ncbi:cysteine synthase A [Pseudooceanicola sp. CBS1P-1]|uniref:Cysteine synthase n=1 Tax=Pseudooceanicola albus TaxID=2692189 RepID=A0A6L7G8Z8_9RHOB|nr:MULTISPECIES: cysteine synthase A [Pseudooceanicola]MBT9386528.1 cysteine synthase A [Pseudooceanicola endophyticus]MXN20561.1 cysteine synthase A [Pseudooceanicola albus]